MPFTSAVATTQVADNKRRPIEEAVTLESFGGNKVLLQLKIDRLNAIEDPEILDYILTYHALPYKHYIETGQLPEINKPDQITFEDFWDRCTNILAQNENVYDNIIWLLVRAFKVPVHGKKGEDE